MNGHESGKRHPTIGCCGIDCGLCPRYYTRGESRCPGCCGVEFEQKHPSCSFITCCAKKRGLEVCAECGDYPCVKFDKETGKRDSFVTHGKIHLNHQMIAQIGIDDFLIRQRQRIVFLETALERFDDGKSKSFFCLAAALLSIESLNEALSIALDGKDLRDALYSLAKAQGIELKLRK